ncbi:hypothetical protein [Henriciella marina]|uniref:Restriction endonuclease type IV Mrr domain-containing protein n=1 Tax=Henriciella marina TaxID=453851 RepID=A0ABT4LVA5_9PROT|nr:hypothetical protein [Henriciella marina]MCZ4298294.1 hypothetical protein [Henriciella marina]
MTEVIDALKSLGPARASRLARYLADKHNWTDENARQRLSRARDPVKRYPKPLFPKNERFFYLKDQRNTELYWSNLHRDLRETGSVYACATDSLTARGGVVSVTGFATISGAPVSLKKQIPSQGVADALVELRVLDQLDVPGLGDCYVLNPYAIASPIPPSEVRVRRQAEAILLDGLREWARRNGFASYDKITIRGDDAPLKVGQFAWDLTGPCYLAPMTGRKMRHGFLVADVCLSTTFDVAEIAYFVRKVQIYSRTSNSGPLLPIIMADSFTGDALKAGHAAGLVMATPQSLFGRQIANGLSSLIATLSNAAAVAAANPQQVLNLLASLSEIEGRAGNLRGVLFELLCGHLSKKETGGSIDLGINHTHKKTYEKADLDIVCVQEAGIVRVIECKAKNPGGTVAKFEVEKWLAKLPVHQDYVSNSRHLRERNQQYCLWTSGEFDADALVLLKEEHAKRTRKPIAWRSGKDLRKIAAELKLKAIGDALDQHYLKHPLSDLSFQ